MEKLIHAIIEADKQAQVRLQVAQEKRMHVRTDAEGQKAAIQMRYQEEVHKRLEEHKQAFQQEFEDAKASRDAQFNDAKARLHETFHSFKERWVETIVKRCQES